MTSMYLARGWACCCSPRPHTGQVHGHRRLASDTAGAGLTDPVNVHGHRASGPLLPVASTPSTYARTATPLPGERCCTDCACPARRLGAGGECRAYGDLLMINELLGQPRTRPLRSSNAGSCAQLRQGNRINSHRPSVISERMACITWLTVSNSDDGVVIRLRFNAPHC